VRRPAGSRAFVAPLAVSVTLFALGACSDPVSSPYGPRTNQVNVRIVNALFQGPDTASASAVPIDYLIDSSSAPPGVLNLAATGMTVGDSGNGYAPIEAGIHSYVARVAGNDTVNSSVYTTSTDLPYLPKQKLLPGAYYTIVEMGIIPVGGLIHDGTVGFMAFYDDPFPGPTVDGVVQARFRLLNLAPYASADGTGATVRVFVTRGNTPPANLLTTVSPYVSSVPFGCSYNCIGNNIEPGAYTITVATQSGSTILAQSPLTFAAGDVVTLILQSSAPSATPGTGNNFLRIITDHHVGS